MGVGICFSALRTLGIRVLPLLALSPAVSAAPIFYGSFMGTNVTYVNVAEDSGNGPLFGAPTVTGNSLDFNPLGFDASSSNGGSDLTVSNLTFMVAAKLGSRIDSITLAEVGDTTLAGNVAPGSMDTASAVFVSGALDIQEVDFVGINHISVPFSMTFSPSGGTYFLGTDGGGGPVFHSTWAGSVTLDIEAILMANAVPYMHGATKVSLDFNNNLTAVSQTGTSAQLAKKDFGASIGITPVPGDIPEPGSLALVAAATVMLGGRRRQLAR